MSNLEEFLHDDKFARYLGVELLDATDGQATARLSIQPHHLNSHNTVHGGLLFSLADAVLFAASNSRGVVAVAITATISYLQAASGGVLTAQATELSLDNRTALYEIRITDEQNKLLALFHGTVYLTNRRIEA